ncbi:DNA polymerase family B-domain-containing protein [Radiomyces spectabilis]|uniref:DNA polymerase family B-domain-containing protein n=1 Tax=Radiomyces spectabilis TaxID=64574 RepID=UPI00221E5A08|nr:DNA polymerase family B-domain-containing protein [Radiomyces spectabilis]KAI8365231.1 DNA polymerase family B-domain-containing protein [Radiomyces spectabilis]
MRYSTVFQRERCHIQKSDILEPDGSLRIWWYDLYEPKQQGSIYVFGKVWHKTMQKYVSCSVAVKNFRRTLFFLPRSQHDDQSSQIPITMADVEEELAEVLPRHGIYDWKSKTVQRKYAFELSDVPSEAEYLKVNYSFDQPVLPVCHSGATYSHVFGSHTSVLEHFLIKRDIMGPCWLEIKDPAFSDTQETWCKVEVHISAPKLCNPLREDIPPPPPLAVLSLSLRTVMNHQTNTNEILAVGGLFCDQVQADKPTSMETISKSRFTVIRPLGNKPYPSDIYEAATKERQDRCHHLQVERTETSLLNWLIAKIHAYDPDVILGHNLQGFDLGILLQRMKVTGTIHWHKLGRLKRKTWPKLQDVGSALSGNTYQERKVLSGRLVCDILVLAKDLIRSKSYHLTELAAQQLGIRREDWAPSTYTKLYQRSDSIVEFARHCSFDSVLSTALMFKLQILPLTKQLTNLAGNTWAHTISGGRAERNEYLLLHEFHRMKYICPDKVVHDKPVVPSMPFEEDERQENENMAVTAVEDTKKKCRFTGGLVLEPKIGFYDKYVLLLDFNSLYPSIIQEYNICFTTVDRPKTTSDDMKDEDLDDIPVTPDPSVPQGVLPRLVKNLVEQRQRIKARMKQDSITEVEKSQLDIQQQALKLTANSVYGCLGFAAARFYARPLAMMVTSKGRDILRDTVTLATNLNLDVIYGDTDSIMIHTGFTDIAKVKTMGLDLARRVNERYRLLEIGIDGFFKHLLLLKKKKYAGLLVEEKQHNHFVESIESKGLDLVRRDWCDLAHDVSLRVLNVILSDKPRAKVIDEIYLIAKQAGRLLHEGNISVDKFVIYKQLTKNVEDYKDSQQYPHVQVAKRMRQAGLRVKAGDTIPYVICCVEAQNDDEDHIPIAQRAFHPDDVKRNLAQLDRAWYASHQIHPPLARLCAPIENLDAEVLATCLGLSVRNPQRKRKPVRNDMAVTAPESSRIIRRHNYSDGLMIRCFSCQAYNEFEGILRSRKDGSLACGLECHKCRRLMTQASVQTQTILAIRAAIRRYYMGWTRCQNASCHDRFRDVSVASGKLCLHNRCQSKVAREYPARQLYHQLSYYSQLFDIDKQLKEVDLSTHTNTEVLMKLCHAKSEMFHDIKSTVDRYMARSNYRYINLAQMLEGEEETLRDEENEQLPDAG